MNLDLQSDCDMEPGPKLAMVKSPGHIEIMGAFISLPKAKSVQSFLLPVYRFIHYVNAPRYNIYFKPSLQTKYFFFQQNSLILFSYFSPKTYVMGTSDKHSIRFHEEISKTLS